MCKKDIGGRIKDVRTALDLKQKQFAIELSLSPSFLSEIEAGRSKPGYDFLHNALVRFSIDPVYILTGAGKMFIERNPILSAILLERFGELGPDIATMLSFMEKSSIVRYSILMDFKTLMMKKKNIIDSEIEISNKKSDAESRDKMPV
jgi:transcriptional regulator with XRE-family HTH domain